MSFSFPPFIAIRWRKARKTKVDGLVRRMFTYFVEHPDGLPEEFRAICEEEGPAGPPAITSPGMTDNYALEVYHALFIPQGWAVKINSFL